MSGSNNNSCEIEYKKWSTVVIKAQFVIAFVVFAVEVINNALLYVTRSQGYGPDTIVGKLIRYLLITSVVNFGLVVISIITDKREKDEIVKRYFLMLFTTLICINVSYSHYQFATVLTIFVIPIIISILYEDWKLSIFTLVLSFIGQTFAVLARANDPLHNKDIGPEAAIAYSFTVAVIIFAKLINSTLKSRRDEVKDAVIKAEKANANAEKMALSFKMLETLAGTIDAKDRYTNGHSVRVSIYSTLLAKALLWDDERINQLRYEALLHDIGKIGVPDIILNKPSKLSPAEFGLIKAHTVIGSDILKNMVAVPNASLVAKYHHERYDGKGYPTGISGEEIPINARIVAIADAYDAMHSDRIYRRALSREIIRKELIEGRGKQFDPYLLDKFVELFDDNKLVINKDKMFISEVSSKQQNVMDDIEKVLDRLTSIDEHRHSLSDFDKFYKYMRNIGLRYNRSIEVLSVDIVCTDEESSYAREEELSDILQMAIQKNIRSVDVYYRYSATKHMVILLDAGVDNIDVIKQRIGFDYDTEAACDGYKLEFSLNESIEAHSRPS